MKSVKFFWEQVLKSKYSELHVIYDVDRTLIASVYSVNMSTFNTYYQVDLKINSLIRPKKLVVRSRRAVNKYIKLALVQVHDINSD